MNKPNLKSMINEAFEGVTPYAATKSRGMQKPLSEEDLKKLGIIPDKDTINEEYVESMGPDFDNGLDLIFDAWNTWKRGPLTDSSMIKPAAKEVTDYIVSQLKKKLK
jgi:hypothetical protein